MPSSLRPQLGAEAAGRGCPGRLELSRPLRPVLSPPFADFGKIPGRAPRGLALLLVPLQAAASPLPTPASQPRASPVPCPNGSVCAALPALSQAWVGMRALHTTAGQSIEMIVVACFFSPPPICINYIVP
uniref:Uncharacterized protein n=1 Tax=Monodon monoceros TaxID=40151 RepID=A0A8C6BNL3_MONMO